MNRLPTPKEIALAAVANHPAITDGQREAMAALIERTLMLDRRQVCDALQQELAGHQKNLDLLRRAIEDILHPRG